MSKRVSGTTTTRRESLAEKHNGYPPNDEKQTIEPTTDYPLAHATAIASEEALRKIWDTPEEDEAWRDL